MGRYDTGDRFGREAISELVHFLEWKNESDLTHPGKYQCNQKREYGHNQRRET